MSKIYYNQADSRWANYPYPSANHPNANCKSSGCGPTCVAMIVSSCKEIVTPDKMCQLSLDNGYRALEGTDDRLFTFIADKYGIEMNRLHSSFEAHQACKDGYFVIICCRAGLWTTGGHYILAVGANDTEIEIYDPYLYNGKFNRPERQGKVRLEGNSAWVEINTFKENSNAQRFYAFKIGNVDVELPTQNETKIMYVNTNSLNLNVRNAPNGNVIGSLAKGTQVVVYEEQNGWSRIGDNKWVATSYLASTISVPSQPEPVVVNRGNVGQTKTFKSNTIIYENSNLTGTKYNYLPKTAVVILENVSDKVDKIRVVKTGRVGYVDIGVYTDSSTQVSKPSTPSIPNTVGQKKVFKAATIIYEKSNLSGTKYNYKANTSVKVLQNVSNSVDKVYVILTGRVGYVSNNVYK